jgi:hypothetical protein
MAWWLGLSTTALTPSFVASFKTKPIPGRVWQLRTRFEVAMLRTSPGSTRSVCTKPSATSHRKTTVDFLV